MSAKATRCRHGRHMFTGRARFNLDINDQINLYGGDLPTSRTAALKIARNHCAEHGDSRVLYGECHDD